MREDEVVRQSEVPPVREGPAGEAHVGAEIRIRDPDEELRPGAGGRPRLPISRVPDEPGPCVAQPGGLLAGSVLERVQRVPLVLGNRRHGSALQPGSEQEAHRRAREAPLDVEGEAVPHEPEPVEVGIRAVVGLQALVVGRFVPDSVPGGRDLLLGAGECRQTPPRGQQVRGVEEDGQIPPPLRREEDPRLHGPDVGRGLAGPVLVQLGDHPVPETLVRVEVEGGQAADLQTRGPAELRLGLGSLP